MNMLEQWLSKSLNRLNLVDSMEQLNGFTRLSYSEEEWKAMDAFTEIAHEIGLEVRMDEAGNRIARWNPTPESESLPAIAIGSHLDTVVNGGGYDGVAGVLCGLGAIKLVKETKKRLIYPIEVICFASEESARFGISTIGSKAMTGFLDVEGVADIKDATGITVKEAIESKGLILEQIVNAKRNDSEIKSFIELHIEQGELLQDANCDIGYVRGIACPTRLTITIKGRAGHTGTTPMGKRKDALVAIAPLITFISQTAEEISKTSPFPLVATASTIQLYPNVMNVIPDVVHLGVDIRSIDDHLKSEMTQKIKEKCTFLEKEFGVVAKTECLVDESSVFLHPNQLKKLQVIGEGMGLKGLELDSGAGHDVMNMAKRWPASLLFIPSKDGISHHPEEYSSIQDLRKGTEILAKFVLQEASGSK
ncbi:M20 family metallo-hydrolase [Heyndrickxia oleronia]|uniref:M20 family metallo-hydrolase n=1 Tax=Heyndrickxia oleronia TaxID=38875 RepID=UPI001B082479|nr:M20 family metallo-hydrolase [Heyndrickxia oleronia]GIN40010.1 putative hydrolase [Heyndrickxia oleronia]